MRGFSVFLAVLAVASAGPITVEELKATLLTDASSRNSILENFVLGILEDLREIIINGNDDIPILDPLQIDRLAIDDQVLPLPGAQISVADLSVSKLSTFEVNSLQINLVSVLLQRYRVELDGSIPQLEVAAGAYDLFIPIFGANVFGSGDMKIQIIEPRIQVNLLIAPSIRIGAIYLNLLECEIKFNLKSFEPEITGLLNDAAVSSFINAFLKNLVSEMLYFFEDDITRILSSTVHDIANEILSDLNLIDILG